MTDPVQLQAVATIAAAYFSHHMVESSRIGSVIASIKTALDDPAPTAAPPVEELKPAVPIRKSVEPDAIICLEDGKRFKSLKRHLRTAFNLTPDQYRERWNLPADYPMVAPNYSATRSKLAKDNGLGKKAA